MSLLPTGGGYPRSEVYLSVECSVPTPSGSTPKVLAGKTKSVSAGGLEILLPETLPLRTPVLIQIGEGEPLRAHVVSVDQAIPTSGGPRIPHGVAFEHAVDPAVVSQWRFRSERQVHTRVPARFPVQYAQAGTGGQGTCVNLSRGGMFIATTNPSSPGSQVSLTFTLPNLSHTFSLLARVVWMRRPETAAAAPSGMGVQFLDPRPSESAVIGAVVDRLSQEASPPPN
ncbi:MAG TPA: TIGR02266 family protein [Candidatus Methylomirabilis sp.]